MFRCTRPIQPESLPERNGGSETESNLKQTIFPAQALQQNWHSKQWLTEGHSQALALSKRARDVTAPSRCSEPLRSKDGGPSKVSPDSAGWDRRDAIGDMTSATAARSSFAASSSAAIDRVQKELKELGLWMFAGAIMYIMQEVFGMPASRLIVPPNEKYGKFVLNEVLEAGNFGKHDERIRFGRSQLGHNLQRVYRDMRLIKYFPAEALSEPIFRVWHFFWRMKNKK